MVMSLLEMKASLFVYCRDGRGKENLKPRKTEKKRFHSETRKLQSSCLSQMTDSEHIRSGEVQMVYVKTHTNHEPGLNEVATTS